MSQLEKFAVPLLVAGAVLTIAGVTAVSSSAAAPKYPVHTLTMTNGTKILQTFDGRTFHALVPGPRGNTPLKDGEYKLTNGGAIKVQGGRIVWDAFGVVEKFEKSGLASYTDPSG